ncbi:hypothetical protein H0A66_06095 [Alcaligenaceae bacterium]|nr:hypothetical protein [Alcaligenaceae bacterium]
MQVTTSKNASQAKKAAQSPTEQRFDKAWKRVANKQKENDRFRENIQAFSQDTSARIQEKEQRYMVAMHGACLHLLTFFNRKSLTQWQRQMLFDWVSEYLEAMQNNPFSSHLDMRLIRQRLADELAVAYPESKQRSTHGADDPADDYDFPDPDEEEPLIQDMFQELFAEFEQADRAGASAEQHDETDADQAFFQDFFQQQQAYEQQRQDESQALKRLMQSSSVNRLFRKVAGVLHPDKEQDEALRQDKNRLMGELIQARDTNDIPRLFAFYTEYVGQSPMEALGEDLDGVTQLLERQYLYLCDLKERILDEDLFAGALYRQFHRKTPVATKRVITKHLKDIQSRTNALLALPEDITSLKSLKPYLELRYDVFCEDAFLDFV